jgi:hypothetical protein
MLESFRPFGDSRHDKMCFNDVIPYWFIGEKTVGPHLATMIK